VTASASLCAMPPAPRIPQRMAGASEGSGAVMVASVLGAGVAVPLSVRHRAWHLLRQVPCRARLTHTGPKGGKARSLSSAIDGARSSMQKDTRIGVAAAAALVAILAVGSAANVVVFADASAPLTPTLVT